MYPESVRYRRARSVPEAVDLLEAYSPDARLLAGGQSLVPLMKFRLAVPDVVIDISHITPEHPIRETEDSVKIHALTTHRAVGDHDGVGTRFDVIRDAIPQLADPQVRNMGTVGGAIAEADPSGDWGPLLLATDGWVNTISPDGERSIPANKLFTGPFQTVLAPAEVIESIELPVPPSPSGGAYLKVKRRQGVYATASVGVQLTLEDTGRCASITAACSAVDATYTTPDLEGVFAGERLTSTRIDRGANIVAAALDPVVDSHGSAGFKRNLCATLFKRATRAAEARAMGTEPSIDPMGAV